MKPVPQYKIIEWPDGTATVQRNYGSNIGWSHLKDLPSVYEAKLWIVDGIIIEEKRN